MDTCRYIKEPPETEANLKRLEALVLEIPRQRAKAQAATRLFNVERTNELGAVAIAERNAFLELKKEFDSLRGKVERSRSKQTKKDNAFWETGKTS